MSYATNDILTELSVYSSSILWLTIRFITLNWKGYFMNKGHFFEKGGWLYREKESMVDVMFAIERSNVCSIRVINFLIMRESVWSHVQVWFCVEQNEYWLTSNWLKSVLIQPLIQILFSDSDTRCLKQKSHKVKVKPHSGTFRNWCFKTKRELRYLTFIYNLRYNYVTSTYAGFDI